MTTLYRKTTTAVSALLSGRQHHNYQTVAGRDRDDGDEDDNDDEQQEHDREPDYSGTSERHQSDRPSILREQTKRFIALILVIVALTAAIVVALVATRPKHPPHTSSCPSTIDADIQKGYNCHPSISHSWGQYSPYFSPPSQISPKVPESCNITFVQVLSRHGARNPTMGRTILYGALIANLQEAIAGKKLDEKYRFLHKYEYKLGHDQLVEFGAEQLWNLGRRIHGTYGKWLGYKTPYVRTTTQQRMRDSARWWMAGYHSADSCKADSDATKKGCRPPGTDISTYHPDVIITEAPGYNNTLSHETCPAFEDTDHGSAAARPFVESFTKAIAMRLNHDLDLFDTPAEIGAPQVLYIMDLCPFETVANFDASHAEKYTLPPLSPFCHLFTEPEWQSYGYYQSISKYYGFGPGNPLGPAQGVGWVNELIARLTDTPVEDSTTTNSSLPFELGRGLYADFSHDNDMMSIFAALKLFDNTRELPKEYVVGPESAEAAGYSAAWAVPFGGRLVVEKMVCTDAETGRMGDVEEAVKEKVRVLMNDRVVPLQWCGGGLDGKCALEEFVDGMSWAREGGNWNECFAESGASL